MPKLVQWIFSKRVWALPNNTNTVYLTFDDGPIPEVTPWVLSELKKYNAKATFFCIGDNINKHPAIFKQIINDGHGIGNHTFNHLNGWKTNANNYIDNVIKCAHTIEAQKINSTNKAEKLFRPPYGKITLKQSKNLQKKGFKIIMWDVLSADYDKHITEETCLQNVLKNIKSGSIIVFHDSLKAEKNLRYVLPKVLEFIKKKGYKCKGLFNIHVK
jgi:peptidoglycan/xylan/chitin deacetylase (PgdA/CDA1 family)